MGENAQGKTIREFSSGGATYKRGGKVTLWLISRSKASKLYPKEIWRLQKGWVDERGSGTLPGPISSGEIKATEEDLRHAAIREMREEGGVEAKIVKKIGTERFFFKSKISGRPTLKFVTFYLMKWQSDLAEGFGFETSEVAWLPFDEAYKRLTNGGEKQILKKAKDLLLT